MKCTSNLYLWRMYNSPILCINLIQRNRSKYNFFPFWYRSAVRLLNPEVLFKNGRKAHAQTLARNTTVMTVMADWRQTGMAGRPIQVDQYCLIVSWSISIMIRPTWIGRPDVPVCRQASVRHYCHYCRVPCQSLCMRRAFQPFLKNTFWIEQSDRPPICTKRTKKLYFEQFLWINTRNRWVIHSS